jgi:hypothetical protein
MFFVQFRIILHDINAKQLISKLDKFSSDVLEIMASLYYLRLESPSLNKNQPVHELKLRKPLFTNLVINKALVIFDIMKDNSLSNNSIKRSLTTMTKS